MNFCPRCGTPLVSQMEGGRERPACPAPDCRYFHFGDYSIGCGGVVIRDGKGLLIQRGINPNRGAWQLPGGYVEADEDIVEAVQREVLEEAGVEAKVQDIVGFRHSIAGSIGGPSANIYVVFRLTPISGEPRFDGDETICQVRRNDEVAPTPDLHICHAFVPTLDHVACAEVKLEGFPSLHGTVEHAIVDGQHAGVMDCHTRTRLCHRTCAHFHIDVDQP